MHYWMIVLIIAMVVGLIVGNILLLKHTAKQKLPKVKKDNNASYDRFDDPE